MHLYILFIFSHNFNLYLDVNLTVIDEYKIKFPDIHIGYSGHELGFIPTLGAVAKGAKIIERHFTLDKTMKGKEKFEIIKIFPILDYFLIHIQDKRAGISKFKILAF